MPNDAKRWLTFTTFYDSSIDMTTVYHKGLCNCEHCLSMRFMDMSTSQINEYFADQTRDLLVRNICEQTVDPAPAKILKLLTGCDPEMDILIPDNHFSLVYQEKGSEDSLVIYLFEIFRRNEEKHYLDLCGLFQITPISL